MTGYTRTEWIDAPPNEVFAFASEMENAPQILAGVVGIVKLTDGPVGVGTRYKETRRMRGQEAESELEIVAYQPPDMYAAGAEQDGIKTIYRYTFTPENGGTRVDLVCDVQAGGLKKLMTPVVASILQREDGDHLAHLKRAIEERLLTRS